MGIARSEDKTLHSLTIQDLYIIMWALKGVERARIIEEDMPSIVMERLTLSKSPAILIVTHDTYLQQLTSTIINKPHNQYLSSSTILIVTHNTYLQQLTITIIKKPHDQNLSSLPPGQR